jgi:hypothetical protein
MFKDSRTSSQRQHDNFYNIAEDKKKFETIISREKFIEKYKECRKATDGTIYSKAAYNEVLGNFFIDSLTGLVARDDTLETKVMLLMLRHHMREKHEADLPMIIMKNGQIQVWEPAKNEIVDIINKLPEVVDRVLLDQKGKLKDISYEGRDFTMQVYVNAARYMGYKVIPSKFDKFIVTEADVKDAGNKPKDLFIAQDIIEVLHKATDLHRGDAFTHGLEGRLLEVANVRRKEEGKKPLTDVKKAVFLEENVKGLIKVLSKEHKILSANKEEVSKLILEQVKINKDNRFAPLNKQSKAQEIGDDKIKKAKFNTLKEFGYKTEKTLGIKSKRVEKLEAESWQDKAGGNKKDIKQILQSEKSEKKAERKWSKKIEKSESSDRSI